MTGAVILIKPARKPDVLDVRLLVAEAVDAFCETFGIAGPARKHVFQAVADQAREMAAEFPQERRQ